MGVGKAGLNHRAAHVRVEDWDAPPGQYRVMSRATDEVGRVEPETPRYNNMRKNFSAIVATDVTVI